MKRSVLARIIAIILVCLTLSGCGGGASDPKNDPTLGPDQDPTPAPTAQPTPAPEIPAEKAGTVWYITPAIPATVGTEINLYGYDVQLTPKTTVARENITWTSEDITINEKGCVTPESPGVYKLNALGQNLEKTIYLIAKAPEDTEYVLYYNDFENAKKSDFTILPAGSSSVKVSDGKLILSDSVCALLPEFIGDFGDYKITTNLTVESAAEETRWLSVMYRIQNDDFPYYQLCVRQNAAASNGVELAHKTESASWAYDGKTAGTEKLDPSKMYEFTIDVHGYYAAAYMDGKKLLETKAGQNELGLGRVGFQTNSCKAVFDDIKIVVQFYEPEEFTFPPETVKVRDINTEIGNPAAIISEVYTGEDFNNILVDSPAVAIFTVNGALEFLSKDGKVITTLENGVDRLGGKVIPAFRPTDENAAKEIARFLKKNNYGDTMIVSNNAEIIKAARKICPTSRGVLDLSGEKLTSNDLLTIRSRTNESTSRICILPANMATQGNTAFLYGLATTVWYKASADNTVEHYTLLTAGANGIVTGNRKLLETAMTSDVFAKNSLIRPVNVIGHRGIPSLAAENTIYGTLLAAENGANIIENDIYITTDGVIVAMHDGTIDRTTNGTGNVESMTYEQLSKFVVDYKGDPQPIPTLEDYFKAIKGKDINLFIEIKSSKRAIVTELKRLIEEYDILDQCCVISFNTTIINYVRKDIPQISAGHLTGIASLNNILVDTGNNDCTFNPSYSGLTEELMLDCTYRGVSIWPWTVNDKNTFLNFFKMGMWGITTDNANYVKNYIKFVSPDESYELTAGKSIDAPISCQTYAGDTINASNVTAIVIDGNSSVSYSNGKLTASEKGTATVIFRVSYSISVSEKINVYSQPVTVNVK